MKSPPPLGKLPKLPGPEFLKWLCQHWQYLCLSLVFPFLLHTREAKKRGGREEPSHVCGEGEGVFVKMVSLSSPPLRYSTHGLGRRRFLSGGRRQQPPAGEGGEERMERGRFLHRVHRERGALG